MSKYYDHKKQMVKYFEQLAGRHNLWQVFTDFLELSALSIRNSVDHTDWQEREDRYLKVIHKYKREEAEIFCNILAELVLELEKEPNDVLGQIFMELNLGNKWKGQFFTPMGVSKLMGTITLNGNDIKSLIDKQGFITVSEPACGGGSTIIGLALAFKELKYNYQKQMVVTAVDVDLRAVHMCYIQLSLLGIPATIVHGNSLLMETYDTFRTPFYMIYGWAFKEEANRKEQKKIKPIQANSLLRDMIGKINKDIGQVKFFA